ncbi:MAG: hypothetical protein GY909_14750 [Oligoflexia bacterium]|nr:hypothetical protein [Oligoflexia bacterium]
MKRYFVEVSTHQKKIEGFRKTETDHYILHYVGSPINFPKDLVEDQLIEIASSINGQFLIYIFLKESKTHHFISDRFSSHQAFYYFDQNQFFLSSHVKDIPVEKTLNKRNILTFFHYQKLFANQTIFEKVFNLNSATIISITKDFQIKEKKYWIPNFKKSQLSLNEAANELSKLLQTSSKKILQDKDCSIFLSGGLDSRVSLAVASPKAAYCIGSHKNNEFEVANELANIKGINLNFIKRNDLQYIQNLEKIIDINSGMNSIIHAHFIEASKEVKKTDYLIHGHGFDYFFQGAYLPSKKEYLLGKRSIYNSLISVDNTKEDYVKNLKFKLKSIDLKELIRPTMKTILDDALNSPLDLVINEIPVETEEMDKWEYLNCHKLSNHYTNLNLKSMEDKNTQIVIAWENDLLDFFYSLPHEYKMNALILKKALKKLSSPIAKVRNANTNTPAHLHHYVQNTIHFSNLVFAKMGLKVKSQPSAEDRSWPEPNELLRSDEWKNYLEKLSTDGIWKQLEIFDEISISNLIKNHLHKKGNYSDFIFSLITLEETMRMNT